MKKIASLLTAMLLGCGMMFAQGFKLEIGGQEVTEGATIEWKGAYDGFVPLTCYMVLTNTTETDIDVRLAFSKENLPEGAVATICGFGTCVDRTYLENTLKAGEVRGKDHELDALDIAYTPNEAMDEFTTACEFTDKTAGKSLKFNIHFVPTRVANEARELAGVRLYPNPGKGLLNLNVPVRAEVDIFTANGQLVKQMKVAAGETVLSLNTAGVYFVRVRANGKQSVKRLVVR